MPQAPTQLTCLPEPRNGNAGSMPDCLCRDANATGRERPALRAVGCSAGTAFEDPQNEERPAMMDDARLFMRAFSDEEERAIRIAWRHGTSITDLSKALDRDPAVVSKHAIRLEIPFSARTNKAPRGPRRGRPAVTLASLLAMGDAADGATRTG